MRGKRHIWAGDDDRVQCSRPFDGHLQSGCRCDSCMFKSIIISHFHQAIYYHRNLPRLHALKQTGDMLRDNERLHSRKGRCWSAAHRMLARLLSHWVDRHRFILEMRLKDSLLSSPTHHPVIMHIALLYCPPSQASSKLRSSPLLWLGHSLYAGTLALVG